MILLTFSGIDSFCSDKIFFDDFSYSKINIPTKQDSANGSIFGFNDWIYPDTIKMQKAWYRWNIGEPQYDSLCGIRLIPEGFEFFIKPGLKQKSILPVTHSTFTFRHGTYASRVRYPRNYNYDNTDWAFWLFSPISFTFSNGRERIQYAAEMDFEWNNWFLKKNVDNLTIGCNNHNYKSPFQLALKLSSFKDGKKMPVEGFDYKCNESDIFYNQWFVCVFVVDTINQITKIYMKSDYDSLPGVKTFGGNDINSVEEIKPFEIKNYSPDYDMVFYYSLGLTSQSVNHDNSFGADWVFYSPDVNLNFDDILSKVKGMKTLGISRMNTALAPDYIHDESNKIVDCFFNGPDSVMQGVDASWKLDTKYLRWSAYQTVFQYRMHDSINGWSPWTEHFSNRLSFNSAHYYDSLELFAHFKDEWREIRDTIFKKIYFFKNPDSTINNDNFQLKIFPVPASYFINISQTNSSWHKIENIRIYSVLGIKLYEQKFSSLIDISFLPPGVYFLSADNHFAKFVKL